MQESEPQTYIIRSGDTITSIAEQFGLPTEAIIATNRGVNPRRLVIGEQIFIPSEWPLPQEVVRPPILTAAGSAIPVERFVVISDRARANILQIFEQGRRLGNNPRAFSKIGDSTSEHTHFLFRFDNDALYDLGVYAELQATIDYYEGSFSRNSLASWIGNHAWSVMDPLRANADICQANETPLACEYRIHRPSIVLIQLGTNEAARPELFETAMSNIIDETLALGVIPILGTKVNNYRDENGSINRIIRGLATSYNVPLWDLEFVASALPDRGLANDGIHFTDYPADYTEDATFFRGQPLQSLTALIAIDRVREAMRTQCRCGRDQPMES